MLYVKDVPMKDSNKRTVLGIGVVPEDTNFVATAIARPGDTRWKPSTKGTGGAIRTLVFCDLSLSSFRYNRLPGQDIKEGDYITGEIGHPIINTTQVYHMQYKDPQGKEGRPFYTCINDYIYKSRSEAQATFQFKNLLGKEVQEAMIEAIRKSVEVLNAKMKILDATSMYLNILKNMKDKKPFVTKRLEGEVKDLSVGAITIPDTQL